MKKADLIRNIMLKENGSAGVSASSTPSGPKKVTGLRRSRPKGEAIVSKPVAKRSPVNNDYKKLNKEILVIRDEIKPAKLRALRTTLGPVNYNKYAVLMIEKLDTIRTDANKGVDSATNPRIKQNFRLINHNAVQLTAQIKRSMSV